jgi:PAS domain S-box-containing protein
LALVAGTDLFLSLFNNLAIFIVLIAVYGFLNSHFEKDTLIKRQSVIGFCFGLFAIVCMYVRIPVHEGVIVDQRNTLIALSGGFGGPLSAAISALLAGAYRLHIGGSGALAGVAGVCLSAVAGIAFYKIKDKVDSVSKAILCAAGATIIILPGFLFVGDLQTGWNLLKAMALPYGSAVFIGVLFIGLLLTHEEHRHWARVEHEKSEIRYREVVEGTDDLITRVDRDGRFTYVNHKANEIIGLAPQACLGLSALVFIHEDDREQTKAWFEDIISRKVPNGSFENRSVSRSGQVRHLQWTSSFLYDHQGEILSVSSIARDVTDRKKSEEEKKQLEFQLVQAQKMEAIGTLAGGIAHDFNNILSAIMGYNELAIDSIDDGSEISEYLKRVMMASYRAKNLVRQILSFSRTDPHEELPVQVSLLVQESLQLLRSAIPTTIEIKQDIRDADEKVLADAVQIHQIIMNLCTNAAQAMEEDGGLLEIGLTTVEFEPDQTGKHLDLEPGKYQKLMVSDTGVGMDGETLARVFEPFFTTKEVDQGTGMGLSVVHGIVASHGGAILAESEPRKGSVFTVYLPVFGGIEAAGEGSEDIQLVGGKERILLVDDEEELATMDKNRLERFGYRVTAATSSVKALEYFKKHPDDFDLLITDYTMPEMTGTTLSKEILAIRPDIPIIIATGFSQQLTPEKVNSLGIKRMLMKPQMGDRFARVVREVLDEDK